jgi:hypothetical protein
MTEDGSPSVGAKDLQDLKGVSRSPAVALMQKQIVPPAPRPKDSSPGVPVASASAVAQEGSLARSAKAAYQALKQFQPSDYVKWFAEYLRYRFGARHAFPTYEGKYPADGIYPLEGSDGEVRMSLAGDWGTGTDEAYRVAELMGKTKPHYTIHLGDVYFVGDAVESAEIFWARPWLGRATPRVNGPWAAKRRSRLTAIMKCMREGLPTLILFFRRLVRCGTVSRRSSWRAISV